MKQLRVGVHYEPSNIDPHLGAAELALQMTNGVFDTLVNKTTDGEYLPGLAESFQISEDQCSYIFTLRRDVLFHDGTAFTAHAVQASFERARDPASKSQLAGSLLGSYRSCHIINDYCLEILLDKPYALFLDALSQAWLAPMSVKAMQENGPGFMRHPVGTGPFIFDRWEAGNCLVIRRNPAYAWAPPVVKNQEKAHLDEIVFKFIADDKKRSEAFERNEVDLIFAANPGDAAPLRARQDTDVTVWPIRGVPVCLMLNIKRTPTDSLAVRQALSHAIDRDALVTEVFKGEFTRAYGPVSQFTLGYEPDVETFYPYNPDKAVTLLEQDGWIMQADGRRYKNSVPLEVIFYALPVNFYPEFGDIITRELAPLGITVKVELCSPPAWIQAGMQGLHNMIPQGKYASSSQLLGFVYHSRNSGAGGYGWSKRGPEDYPEIDTLIEQSDTCIDKAGYVPLFNKVQLAVMQAALAVPLHCNANIVAARTTVSGLTFDAIGAYPLFHDTTIQKSEG
ncbi:ABC transporter substrate-binding protein [Acetobacter thailandicus]|uniref:ABC transporter substrate-binding protein n=1 Tax=Acetobacter thailandicus TaxID=1502842 RepID=UPI001FD11ECA|nr:ABC transporter substrate-binding protein [Acetobacter thailandicus]